MGMYPMGIETAGGGAALVSPAAGAPPGAAAPSVSLSSLFPRRVSQSELALFTRQLASLFGAGLNMGRCLDTLIDHCENTALRITLEQIRQAVQGGTSLWESLSEHPRIFSDLYVNLVRAGEASGQLGTVLE